MSNIWIWLSVAHVFCSALSCPVCKAAIPTRATHPALLTVGIFTSHSCRHPKCHQCEGQVRHHYQRNNNFSVFPACLSFKLQLKWLWHDPVESHGSSDICFCFRKDLDPSLSAKENTTAGGAGLQAGSPELWDQREDLWDCKLKVKQTSLVPCWPKNNQVDWKLDLFLPRSYYGLSLYPEDGEHEWFNWRMMGTGC